MRWLLHCAFLGSLAAVANPSLVVAEPAPTVDKAKMNAARQYVEAGLAAQATGDYDTAITLYEKAYALVPHPVLWFNMAQAHRLAGRDEQALALYAKYLAADSNGAQAQLARTWVADIQARKAEDARAAQEARKMEEARAALARQADANREAAALKADDDAKRAASIEATRKANEEAAKRVDARSAPTLAPRPGRELRIAGIATGGAGVVALGIGVIFGLRARSISNEAAGWDMFHQARFEQGQAAQRDMFILTGVGAAVFVTGSVLYYLGYRAGASADGDVRSAVTFAPTVGPSTIAISAAGHF